MATPTEKFNVTASKGLIIKVLAALLGIGGLAGGYKALAQSPADVPSVVLNRMDTRLDSITTDVNGLKVDVKVLQALQARNNR